jgi:hypothetical protein
MIGIFSGWILSRTGIGKGLQVVILAALVLGGVFFFAKSLGKDEGKREVREGNVDRDVEDWKLEKAQLLNRLDAAIQTTEQAGQMIQEATFREAQANARARETDIRLSNLERSRAQAAARVARVSDDNLEIEIKRTLGLRHENALAVPGYSKTEQRVILNVVTDYPIILKKNEEFKGKVDALGEQVGAMNDRIDAMETRQRGTEEQRDLWKSYGARMDVHYRDAVNAVGRRKRSSKCLWLWKCTDKTLTIPTPEELQKYRPEVP